MSIRLRADTILAAAGAALVLGASTPAGAAGCGDEYTVRPGDTLSRIAAQCDSSVEALMEANPQITSPAAVAIGWTLAVPGADDEGVSTQDALAGLDGVGPVSVAGWIVNGRRCAKLATPDGEEYGVVSPDLSFVSGRAVEVRGHLVDDPTCSGPRTLMVTGLNATEL